MEPNHDRILSTEDYDRIVRDPAVRRAVSRDSLRVFFGIYFRHYIEFPVAKFHEEMIALLEDDAERLLVLMAFRGSAKSTIVSLAFVVWAVIGRQQNKHVLILSQTVPQAKLLLAHIRDEYESNALLRADLGPFVEQEAEWNSSSVVIPKYKARITVASTEQNVRGLRHGPHRPDLVILDDVESLDSVRTREGRDKVFEWVTSDVIPACADGAKIVMLGTMAHPDSVLMRMRARIEEGRMDGAFRRWPIVGEDGRPAWPGKYPDAAAVDAKRRQAGSDSAFRREYMLEDVPEGEPVIQREWIQYYDEAPDLHAYALEAVLISVDAAISDKDTADYTAVVTGALFGRDDNQCIYILPPLVNERMGYYDAIERIRRLYAATPGPMKRVLVEDVSFQRAYYEGFRKAGCNPALVAPHGSKRERLTLTTHMLRSGRILFPRHGAEALIEQIVGLGAEKHDDLADAFSQLVIHCITSERGRARGARGRADAV